jgi:hypothetical protein
LCHLLHQTLKNTEASEEETKRDGETREGWIGNSSARVSCGIGVLALKLNCGLYETWMV